MLSRITNANSNDTGTDLWDKLKDSQKNTINEAKAEIKRGKGIPNNEVMKKYSKWLKK